MFLCKLCCTIFLSCAPIVWACHFDVGRVGNVGAVGRAGDEGNSHTESCAITDPPFRATSE
jgi:hypothetical protein